MQASKVMALGALLALAGVAAGAFGAHSLRDHLTPEQMAIYQTGAQYQLYHALALTLLGAQNRIKARTASWLMLIGIFVFSGSLYALAISGIRWLGAITPIGGVCFLIAWTLVAYEAFRFKPQQD